MSDLNSRLYRDAKDAYRKSEGSPAESPYQMNRAGADKFPDVRTCAGGISTGINFLGYVQHVHYRLVRRRVINNFKMKLGKWARKEKAGKFGWSDLCDIRSLLNSYLSHSGKANAHRIFNKVLKDNKWIFKYFDFRGCKAVLKPEFKAEREKQIWDFIKGGQNGEIY